MENIKKNVVITGDAGFIGKNIKYSYRFDNDFLFIPFNKNHNYSYLENILTDADVVIHCAAENRPCDDSLFTDVNIGLTKIIIDFLVELNPSAKLIFISSIHANGATPYGISKLEGEQLCREYNLLTGAPVSIFRLPGVFGKWAKPNYNSVVATYCFNIANNLPIVINDQNTILTLCYIDDVVDAILLDTKDSYTGFRYIDVNPLYHISLGELASKIKFFNKSRKSLKVDEVGVGFNRALYSTYISYIANENITYDIKMHEDKRGKFVELLKTNSSGQFSFFTANPGIVRGEHFHNTKTEKFFVVKGSAKFYFRCLATNQIDIYEIDEFDSKMIQTLPGWVHKVENIGSTELIVFVWANEVFDTNNPDTYCERIFNEET